MPLFWGIVAFVVITVGLLLTSKPSSQQSGTDVKDNFEHPVASTDKLKPKLYGTRWITSPNVVDYGKYSARPIWSDEVYDD